jgi:MFS family permease
MTAKASIQTASLRGIPATVWALGFVSMLMDISSEMIHALLPVYMVAVLGTSTLMVGIIEGIAEATASITKIFSGALSDWLGKRKLLAVLGYGLGALTKPIFPLAPAIGWLVAARFVDRIGKGIRGAPRDALVADVTPLHLRGELWAAPVTRYDWSLHRPVASYRADVADSRSLPDRVLDRRHSGSSRASDG